jgi:Lhr-like helicase
MASETAIQTFEYLENFKILVCREHGYGLRNLKRHMLEHHAYHRHVRDAIVEHFAACEVACPEEATLPTCAIDPIECLQPPRMGLRCEGWEGEACGFVSTSKEKMSRHCNQHGWRSVPGDRTNWTPVMVQSFCPVSQSPRWFVVTGSDGNDTGDEDAGENPSVSQADRQTIVEAFRTMDDRHRREQETVDAPVETDQTGWWKKTGWIEHLQGSNKRHLAHAARLPSKDEPVLRQVGALVEALVEDCVAGLSTLPQELRRWLRSVKMSETDPRPMGRLQNRESQKRYAAYVKRLICYSLRVLESVDGTAIVNSEGEDDAADGWINVDAMDTTEEGQVEPAVAGPPDTMADARRLFIWKDGQKEKARAVLRSIESGDEEAAQLATLLTFIETFVFSKVYHEPFDCPTIHFLAVLGIDEENDRLRTGNDYSYRVAGLVYCFRVFGLEAVLPAAQRATQGPDEFEAFLEQRRQYLTDGSMSVMSTMISLLAYGKYLAMNHGNAGAIFWEKEDRVMTLHGMRIVMDKFKVMVNRSIADAEDLLWERLLWREGADRFEMDIGALEDDMSFRKRGSYFVTNRQNRLMSSWEDKTVSWMLASRRGSKMRQEDGSWHTRRVKEYLREVDKFRELLLFCMHITGGQPARGPEILSLRYKNGFSQDRNIFVLDGLVMSVTRYHKTQSQWDVPKAVPRFMPWRVGQLVTVYLTYVQPLMERLSVAIGHGCGRSEYLWADATGPWDTTKLTKVMKQRSGEDLGVTLGTMDYRHAAVGMGRRFVGAEFARGYQAENEEVDEPEVESDDPLEISAGRGSAIGVNRYAVPSDIVKHLSEKNIQTFRPLSESWHRFLGLESRKAGVDEGCTPPAKRSRTSLSDVMTPAPSEGIAPTPSRAPVSRMSTSSDCSITSVRSLPAESFAPATPRTPRTPATPTTASTASTSRSWGSDSFCASPPPFLGRGIDATLPPRSPTSPPVAPAKYGRPSEEERSRAVKKALGKPKNAVVTYRSVEQEVAMNRIMDDVDTTLVVVLPTGGGKSLLFTAPACLDDPGMVVVVIPYRRLMDDSVRNARALRIDCLEWTYGVEDPATIVFISADRLSRSFFDYVGRMRSKGLLRKIFVDECHLAVTAHSWRPKVAELSELRGIGVPLVMLTATMPLYMESDLESTMSSSVSTSWIRASTARKTTKYTVNESIADGKLMEEAIRRCGNLAAQLKRRERMVAYCRSKADCEELAGQLNCGFFYAGSPNNPEALKKWLTEGGVIVATTALGTGVSYPGVMLVVHVGLPYGLIDFSQESGRAGRGLARASRARLGGEGRHDPQTKAHDLEPGRACDGRVHQDERLPQARSGEVLRPWRAR